MQKIRIAYPLIAEPNQDPKLENPYLRPLHIPSGPEFLSTFERKGIPVRYGAKGILLNYFPDPEYGGYPSQKAPAGEFTLVITTAFELGERHSTSLWGVSNAARAKRLRLCKWHTGPATALHIDPSTLGDGEPITIVSRPMPNDTYVMSIFVLYKDASGVLGLGAAEGHHNAAVNLNRKLAFLEEVTP